MAIQPQPCVTSVAAMMVSLASVLLLSRMQYVCPSIRQRTTSFRYQGVGRKSRPRLGASEVERKAHVVDCHHVVAFERKDGEGSK